MECEAPAPRSAPLPTCNAAVLMIAPSSCIEPVVRAETGRIASLAARFMSQLMLITRRSPRAFDAVASLRQCTCQVAHSGKCQTPLYPVRRPPSGRRLPLARYRESASAHRRLDLTTDFSRSAVVGTRPSTWSRTFRQPWHSLSRMTWWIRDPFRERYGSKFGSSNSWSAPGFQNTGNVQ